MLLISWLHSFRDTIFLELVNVAITNYGPLQPVD